MLEQPNDSFWVVRQHSPMERCPTFKSIWCIDFFGCSFLQHFETLTFEHTALCANVRHIPLVAVDAFARTHVVLRLQVHRRFLVIWVSHPLWQFVRTEGLVALLVLPFHDAGLDPWDPL